MTTVADLAREPFVSVTTYRRSGEGVATPVWVVPDGDALLVWTVADSGKVKRLRRDPRVDLVVCSRRGAVPDGAEHVAGTATVTDDPAQLAAVQRALAGKYGVQYRVVTVIEKAVATVKRQHSGRVVLRISAA